MSSSSGKSKVSESISQDDPSLLSYLHPFIFIEHVSDFLYPLIEPVIASLSIDALALTDKLFNLFAVLAIHAAFQSLSLQWWFQIAMMLGVGKTILIRRMAAVDKEPRQFLEKTSESVRSGEKLSSCEDTVVGDHDAATTNTGRKWKLDADRVEEFCLRDLRPTFNWLNTVVETFWLKYRAYVKFRFLHHIWPGVKAKLQNTPLRSLEIYDFNIGDRPVRIISIDTTRHGVDDLIVDVEVAYDGNSNLTITYSHKSLNMSIPVTLQKVCVSNIKLRVVLKKMFSRIPFLGGVQIFLLESPVIDWETADAARVVDLPGLNSLIKGAIDSHIIKRFVHPNRLTIPIKLADDLAERLEKMQLPVKVVEHWEVAMPQPVGVVRVTAVRAEALRPTDLSFQHFKKNKNLNPFQPKTFSAPEILPKKSTSDPYVQISIGNAIHRSSAVGNCLEPEWNFVCEFPIEYCPRAAVKIEIIDQNKLTLGKGKGGILAKITEKVSRIQDYGIIEGWYNSQIHQGRAFIRFEWIPLSDDVPLPSLSVDNSEEGNKSPTTTSTSSSGVVCLLAGTLQCSEIIRPTCFLEMTEGTDVSKGTTLDALSNCTSWTFDEGKVFRIKNLQSGDGVLTIKIYDNKTWKWIGEQKFRVSRIVKRDMRGYFRFPNPFTNLKPVSLSLFSKVLYDGAVTSSTDF